MDELMPLRRTRNDQQVPGAVAFGVGRNKLLARARSEASARPGAATTHPPGRRKGLPRVTWALAGIATVATVVTVVGNVSLTAQSARANEVLTAAASEAIQYADVIPGSGQYLRARTHAKWQLCASEGCVPNVQVLDVFVPSDPAGTWVLFRDWGSKSATPNRFETLRAAGGNFYEGSAWVSVNYASIPTGGAAAYAWIDSQYNGGSASREENNFDRIASILETGLVPAAPRAALLEALALIPGVTATDGVANLEGVKGVAIGRTEPFRAGERQEIIIDPDTGLVIGERITAGAALFGWGPNRETALTSLETTIVDEAP